MKNVRLYIFLYFSAVMSLDVVYRSLDHVARDRPPAWGETFIEQSTGYYFHLLLLPAIFLRSRTVFRLSGPPRGSACIFSP